MRRSCSRPTIPTRAERITFPRGVRPARLPARRAAPRQHRNARDGLVVGVIPSAGGAIAAPRGAPFATMIAPRRLEGYFPGNARLPTSAKARSRSPFRLKSDPVDHAPLHIAVRAVRQRRVFQEGLLTGWRGGRFTRSGKAASRTVVAFAAAVLSVWRGRKARMLQFRPLPIVASAVAESVGIARFTL
jgi:hypothetical protein